MRRALHVAGAALLLWTVTLLAAPTAAAVPSVTFKCTPAPADCTGWYRSDVAIEWTVLPSNATKTGCQDQTLTSDTPGTDLSCRADDGSAAVTVELRIKVDKTPPIVTGGQAARDADANGWYNHAVSVEFAGSDQTSGVQACTTATYDGPDDATAAVQGTCVDGAGNVSAPLGYGLKYDETAPTVTDARPERAAHNGWFNKTVQFDVEGIDATSGIAACAPVTYAGPDSATASITGTCRDLAGNASTRPFTFGYDSTPPAIAGGQAARAPDAAGWYNHAVPVAFTGADQLSGVESCTSTTYSGPDDDAASVPGTCMDRAGNVSPPVSLSLRYDATKPVVTGGRAGRAADSEGWYNHAVTVAFDGTDPTAGIANCETLTYSGPDSGAASLAGTCTDRAGNVSTQFPYGLKYDATGPTVTAADPERGPNADDWFNRPVGFTIRGTDATSGVSVCPRVTYSGPDGASASFTASCRDVAGNPANRAFTLKYDSTAPTATASQPTRPPDTAGWFNRPVSVAFSGTDQLSGIDTCATTTYSGPDTGTAGVPGTCADKAGNVSAPLNHVLKYDATGPTVTGGEPGRAANDQGWYRAAVAINFTGTDAVSGVDTCTSTTYSGPDDPSASVTGTCEDKAGNTSSPFPFGLKYDATAPRLTEALPARSPDANGWYNQPVVFGFEGTDATSGVAVCPAVSYTGPDGEAAPLVGRCTDNAGNGAEREFTLNFDNTAPAVARVTPDPPPNAAGWHNGPVTLTFVGDDAMSGVSGCTKATYAGPSSPAAISVPGTCTDVAGNESGTHMHPLKYDAIAPTVTRAEPARPADANGWYNRAVSIAFRGTDQTSGIDSCTTATFSGPDTAGTAIPGTCGDRAGNLSSVLSFPLKFDGTRPVVTGAKAERGPDHAGWFVSPVRFDVTGTDVLSGIDTCPPVTYTGPDGAGAAVAATCRDLAGNSTSRAFPLNYDATAPLLTSVVAAGGDRSVSLSWQTSRDAESVEVVRAPGLDAQPASVVYRGTGASFVDSRVGNGVRYEYELKVRDAAGNVRTHKVVGLPAAPVGAVETAPPPAPAPSVVPRTPPSILPAPGSVLRAGEPPLLRWPRAKRAAYYNVQLFRGGRKVMSAWPKRPQYRLKLRWTFRGERRRLAPGRYRWMVWPGYGRRSKADFGKRIVNSTFTVKRAGAAGT